MACSGLFWFHFIAFHFIAFHFIASHFTVSVRFEYRGQQSTTCHHDGVSPDCIAMRNTCMQGFALLQDWQIRPVNANKSPEASPA